MTKTFGAVLAAGLATAAQAQLAIVNNIPGTYNDISGTGTQLPAGDDTTHQLSNTIGNALFPVNGWINSNGSLGQSGFSTFSNTALPNAGFHGGVGLAPFWDDLNPGAGGTVHWQELVDRVIVQWTNVPFFGSTETVTFQVQVFNSGPVLAQYLYSGTMTSPRQQGNSATIGAQDSATTAVSWSTNTASLQPGMVLSVIPAPGSAALLGLGGLLAMRRRRA